MALLNSLGQKIGSGPLDGTFSGTKNSSGQTMEQANNPTNWNNGVYNPSNTVNTTQPIITSQNIPATNNDLYNQPSNQSYPINTGSSDVAEARKRDDQARIDQEIAADALVQKNYLDMLQRQTAGAEQEYKQREADAKASFEAQEGTQRALQYNLGTAGTAYGFAETVKANNAKQTFFNNLLAEKQDKIAQLTQAYKENDYKRVAALRAQLDKIRTDQDTFLQNERQSQIDQAKDLIDKSKPFEAGGMMYQFNPLTGMYDEKGPAQQNTSQSGDLQNYKFYQEQEMKAGRAPMTFGDWYNKFHGPTPKASPMDELLSTADLEKLSASGTPLPYGTTRGQAAAKGIFVGAQPTYSPNTPEYEAILADKSQEAKNLFNGLDDEKKANVIALLTGEALLSDIAKGMGGAKLATELNAVAQRIDPQYSETVNKQRYSFKLKWNDSNGKAYNVRNGVNTGLQHLARLKELTDQLSTNGDFKKANSLMQWIESNINGPDAGVVAEFQDTVHLLASEIAKAYKGGVPDQQEVQQQVNSINATQPKNVLTSIINNKVNLMTGLLTSQANEYKNIMGNYPTQIVSPDTLETLKHAGVDTGILEQKIEKQAPKSSYSSSSDSGGYDWGSIDTSDF